MRAMPLDRTIPDRRRTRLGRALVRLVGAAILVACAGGARAQDTAVDGAGAGAYLLGFIQYVSWPAEESIAAWQVCMLTPLGKAAPYGGGVARGKPVAVRTVAAGDTLAGCQILDLTVAPAASVRALLAQARKLPILTVGESSAFCTAGGVVCLRGGDEAGGFEINLSAVQEAGLRVNAQLLMLGRKRESARGSQ